VKVQKIFLSKKREKKRKGGSFQLKFKKDETAEDTSKLKESLGQVK
jgi:hypothetical protein